MTRREVAGGETLRLLESLPNARYNDTIRNIAVSMASFIAAIDSDSNAVAEYIEHRLLPLAACARVDIRVGDVLKAIARGATTPTPRSGRRLR